MDAAEVMKQSRDLMTVKRVFGASYEKDGVTIIPVAKVQGGGGGGEGESNDKDGPQRGSGGGFGVNARPAGVYIVKDGNVEWQPAIDWNRIVMGAQVIAGMVVAGWVLRRFASRG